MSDRNVRLCHLADIPTGPPNASFGLKQTLLWKEPMWDGGSIVPLAEPAQVTFVISTPRMGT